MTKARNIADLLDATGDVVSSALDNVPPSDNASSLTTGTLPVARLADGSITGTKISDGSITNAKLGNDAKVVKSASAPSNPNNGDLWYDETNEVLKYYQASSSAFLKVSSAVPSLSTITGNINTGETTNLTFSGINFLTSNLIINFTQVSDGVDVDVTVTPTSDTSATVAVPSSVFNNVSGGNIVSIKVTNSDGVSSNTLTKTVVGIPSGGTKTTDGNASIHTFTSSGTFTVPSGTTLSNVDFLIIGGGGGGGFGYYGGGGGAGGLRTSYGSTSGGGASSESAIATLTAGNYTVTVGAGGAGGTSLGGQGTDGGDSTFNGITSIGGGAGENRDGNGVGGRNGGSGGGSAYSSAGGSGTSGQGYAGGDLTGFLKYGSGGGGASQTGRVPTGEYGVDTNNSLGADGGDGLSVSITGSSVAYAGGGAGGSRFTSIRQGGTGGGGNGGDSTQANITPPQNGTDGKGGGGGGGYNNGSANQVGADGGDGVVIIRYQL
jgi:hypothetical protein